MLPIIKLFGKDYGRLQFDSIRGENGLDIFTKVSLVYPGGVATATCGLGVKSEGRLLIAGTKGYIVAEAPWWKTSYFEVHYEDPGQVEKHSERFLGDGLRYEISDFLSMINGNNDNGFKLTRGESVALAGMMERFLEEEGRPGPGSTGLTDTNGPNLEGGNKHRGDRDEDMGTQGVQPDVPRKYPACI